jgi:hypothetical protein
VVDPTRALVALSAAFALSLVPALALAPALAGVQPAVASPLLTLAVTPALYRLFGRAEGGATG